jgi:hypothetical protein
LAFPAQVQHLLRDKEHAKAMAMFDAQLAFKSEDQFCQNGLLKAMGEASYNHTLAKYQETCHERLGVFGAFDEALDSLFTKNDHEGRNTIFFEKSCFEKLADLLCRFLLK